MPIDGHTRPGDEYSAGLHLSVIFDNGRGDSRIPGHTQNTGN
jgi:hypothetical protein